jgi:hypothetical protein
MVSAQHLSKGKSAMTSAIDDEEVERVIDIIGDGALTAEAQERLHHEGLWPLYESLRQSACEAFVFGSRSEQPKKSWLGDTAEQSSFANQIE